MDSIDSTRRAHNFKVVIWYDGTEEDLSTDPLIACTRRFENKVDISVIRKNYRDLGSNKGEVMSFPLLLRYIISNLPALDHVYLVENDYLHSSDSMDLLLYLEETNSDNSYYSLYKSPDYDRLPIHMNYHGGVTTLNGIDFRRVLNTTGTFFTRVDTLAQDYPLFLSYSDFDAFNRLVGLKGRLLYVPLLSRASHSMHGQEVEIVGGLDAIIKRWHS